MAKIDPAGLKPVNPFTQQGPKAQSLQVAVQEINASQAARWRVEAGESVSLAAAAAQAGLTEMSRTVHEELSQLSADYITGQAEAAARREADLLQSFEKSANDLAAAREKQQQSFARSAGSNKAGGQFNQEFMRRLGVQNHAQLKNIPTRRLTGK